MIGVRTRDFIFGSLKVLSPFIIACGIFGLLFWSIHSPYVAESTVKQDKTYAAVEALKNQTALVPLDAEYTTAETSSVQKMMMTAQMTTILTGQVEYRVDMSKLETHLQDKKIVVKVPEPTLSNVTFDVDQVTTYDNNSFLFANDDIRKSLYENNISRARDKIKNIATRNIPKAKTNAILILYGMLSFAKQAGYEVEIE